MSALGFSSGLPFIDQTLEHLLARLWTQQAGLAPHGADSLLGKEKVMF